METNRAQRRRSETRRRPGAKTAHLMTANPERTVVGSITGAAAGAMSGVIAGPPGVVAGAVIGATVGAMAGAAVGADQQEKTAINEKLDRDIGGIGGHIGAAAPNQPPAPVGTYAPALGSAPRPDES